MPGSRTPASPPNTRKSIGQDALDALRYWLPKLADPATSPINAVTAPLNAMITPGMIPASYGLDALMKTRFGKEVVQGLDALPPGENLADDGLRAAAAIGPLTVAQLNRVNRMRQGPTAKPTDYFHSKVADAINQWVGGFKDHGKAVGRSTLEQLYNKLKNAGFNKSEMGQIGSAFNYNTLPKDLEFSIAPKDISGRLEEILPQITVQENSAGALRSEGLPPLAANPYLAESDYYQYKPRYSQVTSPFSPENYREFLIRNSQQMSDAPTGHWGDPTVAAHLRTHDITHPELGRVLFADEIQSDVAQKDPANASLLNYEDLAAKFLYRRAADEGYDAIALNTPAVQIARNLGYKNSARTGLPPLDFETVRTDNYTGEQDYFISQHLSDQYDEMVNSMERGSSNTEALISNFIEAYNKKIQQPESVRFQGFLDFYGKNLPKAMQKHLKNMGLSPEQAAGREVPYLFPPTTRHDPIEQVKASYEIDRPIDAGYIHPPFTQPLVYPIKKEHKSGGLAGHTDSFWGLLGALGLGGLAEMTKKKVTSQQE